jgi:hypothetical protein
MPLPVHPEGITGEKENPHFEWGLYEKKQILLLLSAGQRFSKVVQDP